MKFYNCLIMCKVHNIIIKNMKAKTILFFKFKRFTFIEEKKVEDNKVRITLR